MIGWDHTNIQAIKELLESQMPSFYAFHNRNWTTYNAILVIRHKLNEYVKLLTAVEKSHQELLDFLAAVPPSEILKDRGIRFKGWKVTIERLLKAEASDEKEHAEQLRQLARV